jgi:capsid protein
VDHFVQERIDAFTLADVVLIEQQPIGGHTAVEQLLYSRFREKAHLVSPCAMHKFYGIRSEDYEGRKRFVERSVLQLKNIDANVRIQIQEMERRHDVCDAICMARFWYSRHRQYTPVLQLPLPITGADPTVKMDADNPFYMFTYTRT